MHLVFLLLLFENNSFNSFMSPEETMELLSQTLNTKQCTLFENTSLEFCITNDYNIDGKRWNCIEHLVEHHHNLFSKQDIKGSVIFYWSTIVE